MSKARMVKVRRKDPELYAEDCSVCIPYGAYYSSTGNLVISNGMGGYLILGPDSIVLTDQEGRRVLIGRPDFEKEYDILEELPNE